MVSSKVDYRSSIGPLKVGGMGGFELPSYDRLMRVVMCVFDELERSHSNLRSSPTSRNLCSPP